MTHYPELTHRPPWDTTSRRFALCHNCREGWRLNSLIPVISCPRCLEMMDIRDFPEDKDIPYPPADLEQW